jgi:hypothetical protein
MAKIAILAGKLISNGCRNFRDLCHSPHLEKWFFKDPDLSLITVVRFLGRTPNSTTVNSTLLSVCQQICYNLEVPMETIPEEFVPLKNFFRALVEKSTKMKYRIIIVLGIWHLFTLVFVQWSK